MAQIIQSLITAWLVTFAIISEMRSLHFKVFQLVFLVHVFLEGNDSNVILTGIALVQGAGYEQWVLALLIG